MISEQGTNGPYTSHWFILMTLCFSKWQYEKQLRIWRTSKYITQDAWAIMFETVDQLRSQDQESRILVNGKLDEPKIRRARARQTCHKKRSNSMSQRNAKGDFCPRPRLLAIGIANFVI